MTTPDRPDGMRAMPGTLDPVPLERRPPARLPPYAIAPAAETEPSPAEVLARLRNPAVGQEEMRELPQLESALAEIVRRYVSDQLLSREKYGATALNAILALALLNEGMIPGIAERLRPLEANWFRELVARRARQTKDDLGGRFGHGEAAVSISRLEMLAGLLK